MKKIYIEISDICGLKCDFCPAPKGKRGVMDLATFRKAAFEARHFTRLIALHILGDPLSVGNLAEYLKIAKEANLSVEITTSGVNLAYFDLLLCAPIKQVNFSLDAIRVLKNAPFLMRRICDFCEYKINKKSEIFINLRVQKRAENTEIVEFLAQNLAFLPKVQNLPQIFSQILRNTPKSQNLVENRIKLGSKIIIDFRDIFEWQIDSAKSQNLGENISSLRDSAKQNRGKPPYKKSQNLESGLQETSHSLVLPRSPTLARNDEFFRDSSPKAQNGNFKKIAESRLDSPPSTHEANSSIFDEKSGLCSCERENRTNGSLTKRATNLPDLSQKDAEFATCLALKSHIGILSNGTIVPCCIDALGILALGNIKEISLDSALKSARAQKMLQGFKENRLIEHFCQKCDYKNRFT